MHTSCMYSSVLLSHVNLCNHQNQDTELFHKYVPWVKEKEGSTGGYQGSEIILYDILWVNTCNYTFVKPVECTIPGVNYGFCVIRMCQFKYINYNKCITMDIDGGGTCASVGTGGILELYFLFCFAVNLKLLQKIKYI